MAEPLRVLLLGGDPLARSGLAALVAQDAGLSVVGQGVPQESAPLVDALDPDVVLWDLGLAPASDDDGGEGTPAAGAPLLALVAGEGQLAEARMAGARGVLHRDTDAQRLGAAIRALAQGLTVLDEPSAAALIRPASRDSRELIEALTAREQEVLQLLASGKSNKQIAQRLGISEHTAKFHVAKVLQKLGAESRSEAVFIGARLGLLLV